MRSNIIKTVATACLLLAFSTMTVEQAVAEPAHPHPVTISQPDGTSLTLKLVGDEFYHFNTTADGYTLLQNKEGYYVYAQQQGENIVPSQVVAHDASQRNAAEQAFVSKLPKHLTTTPSVKRAQKLRATRDGQAKEEQFDYTKFKGLVVLINYTDRQFNLSDANAFYDDMLNTHNYTGFSINNRWQSCPGSVRDYFYDNSNGMFDPHFDVLGPVNVDYTCTTPQGSSNASGIFKAALDAVDDEVDFSQYDTDGDSFVDMVFFIVAGYSASYSGNNNDYLWPHKYVLINPATYSYYDYDNVYIGTYACSTEIYGWESYGYTMPAGIGTICHEFSHVLGLPDFYDTDYGANGQSNHPDDWDVMAGGSHSNYGRIPVGYSIFERYALGFAQPTEITTTGNYTLRNVATHNEGYILRTPVDNEYFIMENRQQSGKWDQALPGHGMLVARVDSTNADVWWSNSVNDDPRHNYYEIVRAGNGNGASGSDPFPGTAGVTEITNVSTPSLLTWGGVFNPYNILNIQENGGIITFEVKSEDEITSIVEDFEAMSVGTPSEPLKGNFATWSFTKSTVAAPGAGKCNGEHAASMVTPSAVSMETPIGINLYTMNVTFFNPTTTEAKYKLYYRTSPDSAWVDAKLDDVFVPSRSQATVNWSVGKFGKAMFRIQQYAGSKTAKTYIDDITFYCIRETGDVNLDGKVNVSDVTALINMILGITPKYELLSDLNGDGKVNVSDVTALINKILGM